MPNNNIMIEGARIGFRNFSGLAGTYNPAGARNFCIFLEEDLAIKLTEDGWNVKMLPAREEGDLPQAYLQVTVSFANIPPKIVMITRGGKTTLTENMLEKLDVAAFSNVDLIVSPYNWTVNKKSGIKAYLKTLFVTLLEDDLEAKYADLAERPDSAYNAPAEDNV